eukprot:6049547-Alexandrium_andersonii.AAC.1
MARPVHRLHQSCTALVDMLDRPRWLEIRTVPQARSIARSANSKTPEFVLGAEFGWRRDLISGAPL